MRIIGEIPHQTYKITVLKMNEKVTLQIENGLFSQSYVFRDGSGVNTAQDATRFMTDTFIKSVNVRFVEMEKDYYLALKEMGDEEIELLTII